MNTELSSGQPKEELKELESVVEPKSEDKKTTMPSQTSLTRHSQTSERSVHLNTPVAPDRDFTKVANSIAREAVPAGVFKGKSKLLYDCLYRMTRGAVVPSRSIRISRPKLMKAAGIGSRVTFDANINHLCAVGLIDVKSIAGEHDGNEYTVYIPEEMEQTLTRQTSLSSQTGYAQKLDRLVCLETSQTRHTSSLDVSSVSPDPKTFSKTTTDDDDGIGRFAEVIRLAAATVVGQDLPKTDLERERWNELANLLSEELRQAAGRAGQISSVPAFFAAHLRRRLKSGGVMRSEPRPDARLVKSQAAALSKEQKLLKMIKELRLLHVGDPDYQESDLIDDLSFRCQKAGLEWDEEIIHRLLKPDENDLRQK